MAKLTTTGEALSTYDPKLTVYVEGDDDILILRDRWFGASKSRTPRLEFDLPPNGGGCENVLSAVAGRRSSTRDRAYGLLDRDALTRKREWELFLNPDDRHFHAGQPFGQYVRVLTRWEMENFLMADVDVVAEELKHYHLTSSSDPTAVATALLEIAELLKPLTAAIVWSRRQNPAPGDPPERFAQDANTRHEVESRLFLWQERLQSDYASIIVDIDCFDAPEGADAVERWRAVSRILDGKRIVRTVLARMAKVSSEEEFRRFRSRVAERLAAIGSIDAEIVGAISYFERTP